MMVSLRGSIAVLVALASGRLEAQLAPPPFPGTEGALFRSDAAGTRPQIGYDLTGLMVGPFKVSATATGSVGIDSNVFNRPDARSDIVFVGQPSVRIASDWGRHAIALDAFGRFSRFAQLTEQNSDEYSVRGTGRVDIGARSYATIDGGYARLVEPRGSAGLNFDGGTPSVYRQGKADVGASTTLGAARASVTVGVEERRYEPITPPDGPRFDQGFRDTRTISVAPRLDYAISGPIGVFVSGAYTSLASTRPLPCCRRDADGGLVLGGVHVAMDDMVIGEIAAGWRRRNFDLARYRDYAGVALYAKVDWYPTGLLSFRLAADQDFENSGIVEVAGILARQVSLTGYYELLRNLNLTATSLYLDERYRGLGVHTDTVRVSLGAQYLLNRVVGVGFDLAYRHRSSSDFTVIPTYAGVQANLSVTVRAAPGGAGAPATRKQ